MRSLLALRIGRDSRNVADTECVTMICVTGASAGVEGAVEGEGERELEGKEWSER